MLGSLVGVSRALGLGQLATVPFRMDRVSAVCEIHTAASATIRCESDSCALLLNQNTTRQGSHALLRISCCLCRLPSNACAQAAAGAVTQWPRPAAFGGAGRQLHISAEESPRQVSGCQQSQCCSRSHQPSYCSWNSFAGQHNWLEASLLDQACD